MKKTIDKVLACIEIQEKLGYEYLKVVGIEEIKHQPHQYVVGENHLMYAKHHFNGMINEAMMKDFEQDGGLCASPGCKLKMADHSYERALILSKARDIPADEVRILLPKIKQLLLKYEIDGIAFADKQHHGHGQ